MKVEWHKYAAYRDPSAYYQDEAPEVCAKPFHVPNVKDEPRPWLARLVLLGAQGVTAKVVGSSAWLGGYAALVAD